MSGDNPAVRRRTASLERYRGGWALVSGAARVEGLGYAFARALAAAGVNLVLVDVLDGPLHERAGELESRFGVAVRVAVCDLGDPAPYPAVEAAVAGIAVDLLVCNHMLTPADTPPILDMPLDLHSRVIDVNARGYTNLIHRFATDMRRRGRGAVVIVSSGAGLTSAPYTSAYAANKAFQIALGEGLWYELRGSGVDVLVMIGGLMHTQGDALDQYPRFLIARPEDVATEVLSAIGRKHLIIPGRINRAFVLLQTRLLPRRTMLTAIGRFMARGLGKDG